MSDRADKVVAAVVVVAACCLVAIGVLAIISISDTPAGPSAIQVATTRCSHQGGIREIGSYQDFVVCKSGKAYNLP